MAISGELWYSSAGPGPTSTEPAPTDKTDGDSRVGHLYSDGSHAADTGTYVNSGDVFGVQLDTADNLYFALADDADNSGYDTLVVGNIATGAKIGTINIAQNGNGDTFDIINDFAVDYANHVLYVGISGGASGADEGIFKVTYDPHAATDNPGATGGLNAGYNAAADSPNANGALLTNSTQPGYHNGIGFQIDPTTEKLYYIDDDFEGYAGYDNTSVNGGRTNGIYVVSTTSGANPTPTLLSSQSQFPTLDGNYDSSNHVEIISMALDVAKGLIYFTTDDINDGGSSETFNLNTANDALWYMPITGGTATRVTQTSSGARLPITYPLGDNGESSFNGLTLDANSQTLYLTDNALNGSAAKILQLQLNSAGTQATVLSGNFYSVDPSTAAEATPTDLTFAALPTLTLTGTSAKPLQGGGAVTALASTPTLTDPDSNIASVTVQVTENGVVESGDVLALNGSLPGGITKSYNGATGTLTLSGVATGATYATLLGEVTYQDGHTDTGAGHSTRTLTWTAYDGEAGAPTDPTYNQKTTTLTIDRAPSVATHTVTVVQGGSVPTAALGDTDPDGDGVTVSAAIAPANNTYSSGSGYYVISPNAGYSGGDLALYSNDTYAYTSPASESSPRAGGLGMSGGHYTDTFNYIVSDGQGATSQETLVVTIDRPPVGVSQSHTVTDGATLSEAAASGALAGASDPDSTTTTFTVESVTPGGGSATAVGAGGTTTIDGEYGNLVISADGSYSYTPGATADEQGNISASGSHPSDSFTVTLGDTDGPGTGTETLSFTVDQPPVATTHSMSVVEAGSAAASAGDTDPDGDTLTVTALNGGTVGTALAGTYGALTLNSDDSYSYTADDTAAIDAAATGSHPLDSFTYTVSDGYGGTASETLQFSIDRDPTATTHSAAVVEGGSSAASAGDTDPDGDALTVTGVTGGTIGTALAGTYGTLTLNGDDSYSYTADDTSAIDTAATGSHPVDSFTYTVSDGFGGTASETLQFSLDRDPAVTTHSAAVVEGGSSAASAGDTDPDGDALTVTGVTGGTVGTALAGTYGTLTLNSDDSYSYTADDTTAIDAAATDSHPVDSFTYTVSDGLGGTATETLQFSIDRDPTATTHSAAVVEGGAAAASAGDTDPDGDALTVTGVTGGAVGVALAGTYGTLTLNGDDSYSYTADDTAAIDAAATGSHPVDSFTYTVGDGLGGTASDTLQFSIDRAPTAATHSVDVSEAGSAAASAGDTDPDGDAITVTGLTGGTVGTALAGTYGTLTLNGDDSYSYTADDTAAIDSAATGSHPVDSFTYTVSDGLGGSTTETLQFSIDRAPLVGGLAASLDYTEGAAAATLAPAVTASDPDGDQLGGALVSITGLQAGDVLSADTSGTSIMASYDSAAGVLSLTGADTAADYQQVLESVAFAAATEDAADYTGASTRTISWTAADVLGATSVSGSETVDLGVVFADTSANVSATLDQLQAHVASLMSIQITDGLPLDITAAQDANDALALAKLVGPYELDVSGVAGQPYDAFTQSYSAQDLLTSETLSGYDQATYGYASLTDTFDTSGRVTMQVYETSGGATVESVAITYNTDGSSMETVSGFSGQPYTSYTQSFDPSGHMTAETLSGYDQATYGYASVADTFDSQGRVTGQTYETSGGAVVESVSTTYDTDGSSVETVSGVTGQPYTSYSQSFDSSGHMTAETLSGYDMSTYGYASVADTFDSSGRVTGQTYETSGGAVVESVSTTYNTDGTTTESVTGVTGQPYTSYSQTLDSGGHLTAETLSGYDMSTYGYLSVMDTFDTAGRVTAQTYETSGGTVVENVAATYNTDGSSSVTYSGIQGQPYTGYTQTFDASDHMLAEQVTDTDGGRTDYAFADGQTFLSTTVNQSQNAIGTDETFVIQPGFASVTLNGYQPGADSFDISSSLFGDFNDLIAHATPDGDSATLVTYDAQESFVILGATIAQLQSHSSDFHFV